MKTLKYIVGLVLVYFIINFHIEDYEIGNVSFLSSLSLLSTLYLFLMYLIDYYVRITSKVVIIIKFILLFFSVFIFQGLISNYYSKYLPFTFIIVFPIFFLIRDFIDYNKEMDNEKTKDI